MNLWTRAEEHLARSIEDINFTGVAVTVRAPSGEELPMVGLSQDIAQAVDPQTGVVVSGRLVTVVLRLSTIRSSNLPGIPQGTSSASSRPWVVLHRGFAFKVKESHPDNTAGVLVLILEAYRDN